MNYQIPNLPLFKNRPVPWFVKDPKDFREIDSKKLHKAAHERLCWICGNKLGREVAFLLSIRQVPYALTSEPGSHPDCAKYALEVCPFLNQSKDYSFKTDYIPNTIPKEFRVSCLWITNGYSLIHKKIGSDQILVFKLKPKIQEIIYYRQGRLATKDEIEAAREFIL